jgi:hypothetical protein
MQIWRIFFQILLIECYTYIIELLLYVIKKKKRYVYFFATDFKV